MTHNTHNDVWHSGASTVYRHAWANQGHTIELEIIVGHEPTHDDAALFGAVIAAVTKALETDAMRHRNVNLIQGLT